MLITAGDARSAEVGQGSPLDDLVPDPRGMEPVCDEDEFAEILAEMVADEAPRLFAVVQVYGERVDARIAAWGMAFHDHAEVVPVRRGPRMNLLAPENALRMFKFGSHVQARLVWFDPDAATPVEDQIA
ncbi:hypothetical protein [Amycolatopsis sp. NPDC059021]|uniref:hypothetical protein n=1 Tax=Amycolatopsis sp. NPDC059021 TaxID=3346704 RepID=UPI003671C93C